VHVEAHQLNRVGNVGSGEGEVLESPSQAAVYSWVINGGGQVGGDLGLSVNRSGAWLESLMPVCSRMSRAYWHEWRKKLSYRCSFETPRKWWRGPRSFIMNCCCRAVVVCWRSFRLEAVRTMLST
jgi:hypothetical protein